MSQQHCHFLSRDIFVSIFNPTLSSNLLRVKFGDRKEEHNTPLSQLPYDEIKEIK